MAAYDLEEQEQLAELKAWWKQYGNLVVNVVLAVVIAAAAWQGRNWYQGSQSGQAAGVYGALQKAVQDKDLQKIKAASGELLEKYGSSSYASLGALSAAKALVEADDTKTARLQLAWVAENGKDEVRDLARLRLASLLLDEKAYDEALKQLEGSVSPAFAARFMDMKGDVLAAQDKKADAVTAYQAAVDKIKELDKAADTKGGSQVQAAGMLQELLQQKIDALGGSK